MRQGFGTTFIEQMIKRTFPAEVMIDYLPEGLICHMVLPQEKVAVIGDPMVHVIMQA